MSKITQLLNRVAGGGMLAASLILASPVSALACTQIYVGSGVTTTGSTYVGRAEDYSSRYAKGFGVQESEENPSFVSYEVENGFNWTYEGTSHRYTYVRDLPSEWGAEGNAAASKVYSEAGTNDAGVSVSATLTTSMNSSIEAVDPGLDSGIGEYNLADVILAISDSALDGVQKLGAIIDEQGSYDCNQIIIADSTQTFIFIQLSGHQWIALNLDDDVASVNPNMGDLQYKVDLDDESQCLHSAGILTTAEEAGTLAYYDDGTPNIAASYGPANSGAGQNTRYAQGRAYFGSALTEGTDYTVNENGQVTSLSSDAKQLFFEPASLVDTFTALRSFAARGEQVDSLNANLNGNLYAIGNSRTVESNMFEIRSGLSSDIATIQWEALTRAEFSVFLPSYSALLTEVPEDYYPSWDEMDGSHAGYRDTVSTALEEAPDQSIDYLMMDINTLAYNNRSSMAENTRAYLDVLQKEIIAQQEVVDQIMQATPAGDERTALANEAFAVVSEQVYTKCKQLLDEMRAYVKAGDTSTAFVPSDYDAATGTAKTAFLYSSAFVAPTITAQPASATLAQGAVGATLSVAATVNDSATGSDALLTYQWYKKNAAGEFEAIEGATTATLELDASAAGTSTYYVVVTSGTGLTTTSDEVAITVNAKKEEPKQDEKQDTGKKSDDENSNKKSKAKKSKAGLPQTGDNAAALATVIVVSGAIALGAGVMLSKKRS